MTEERKIQLAVEVDATPARTGFQEVRAGAQQMAEGVARSGAQAGAAIDGIGTSASASAAKVDTNTRNLIASIQRTTAAMEAGSRTGAQYYEVLAGQRGVDVNVLRPYLDQLSEVAVRQRAAAAAAEESGTALERAAAAARAEAAAQRESAQAQAGRDAFLAGLREQIALYGRSSEEILRYRAAQAGVAESASPLILQLQNVRAAHEQVAAAARAEAQAQREALQVQNGQNSFIASLEQQATAIGRTRSELLELQAAQMGVTAQAAPFIARIREAEGGIARTGVSAAQTAAALRGVPAQFTDIVTSLQGGQAPITVFLQQGGQLRDMFGSAGGAARALGGYVLGLVNPFTVAAGAALALAVAYHQGGQEADAYTRALILTGNAAGTTTNQLADMAQKISSSVGTQGAAAEALAALVGTGKVSAANLQQFATVAVQAQRSIGKSVADTAKDFEDLGRAPLQATEKLNDQYHYLTGAVYAQIKALEEQGRQQDAASVAQSAYAKGSEELSTKLMATLPPVEKAWLSIKDAAKGAWDAMLNVGREDTLEQQLARVQEQLRKIREKKQTGQKSMLGGGAVGFDSTSADSDSEKQAMAVEASLKRQIDAKDRLAAIDAGRNALNEADVQWQKDSEKYLTRKQQLERDLLANRQKGLAAGMSDKDINARAVAIQTSYSDIFNAGIDSQIEAIKRRGAVEDSVAQRSLDLLNSNRSAGLIREEDYIAAVAQYDQAAYEKEKQRLQDELTLTKGKQNSVKEQAALRGEIDKVEADQVSRKLKAENDLNELEIKRTRTAADNSAKVMESAMAERDSLQQQLLAQSDYNEQIGLSAKQVAELASARLLERAARKDAAADTADTIIGREQETQVLRDQAQALRDLAASQTYGAAKAYSFEEQKKLWESIDQTAHDTFVNIFDNGKNAFDRLRDTLKSGLLDLLYQMTIKRFILNIGAQVSGFSGIAPDGSPAGGGAVSAATSLLSAASAAKTGYGIVAGGLAGVGSAITTAGNLFGSSAVSAFGAGLTGGQTAAAYAAYGGQAAAGGLAAGETISTALAAIPGWGWAALGAAAVAGYLGVFSGGGPESDTRLQFASNNTPGNISINERGNEGKSAAYIDNYGTSAFGTFGVNSSFWSPSDSKTIQSFIKTVSQTDDALADFLTDTEKASVSSYLTGKTDTAHFGAEGSDQSASGDLDKVFANRINNILEGVSPGLSKVEAGFSGTSQELAAEATALLQYRAALKDAGETVFGVKVTLEQVAALRNSGELASAALTRVTNEFSATNQAAVALGKSAADAFGAAGLASTSAREQFILAAGGIDALGAKTTSFAQNYLTDEQRLAPIAKSVGDALAALGYASINTRDQLRDQIQKQDLATEAGRTMAASLLALADNFALVHAAGRSSSDIASERAGLQKQYDDLTMTSTQLLEKQRAALDASNQSLFDQVTAQQAATENATKLASANKGYQDQIDTLLKATMSAADVRAMETKGMDASTVALYDRLAGLNAETEAKKAADTAAAALASKNAGYQQQIDTLLKASMSAADVRAMETKGMDASTVALYDRLAALNAETEAKKAADAAAAALASTNQGYQQQIDTLLKASMSAADVRAMETKGMDASTVALYDRLAGLNAEKAAHVAMDSALQGVIEKSRESAKALREYRDSLLGGELSPLSSSARQSELMREFDSADPDHKQAAADRYLAIAKANAASQLDYTRIFANVQGGLSSAADAQDNRDIAMANFSATLAQFFRNAGIGAHANGGIASGLSLVGERGPELVDFERPARVYTASQSLQMLGSSSGRDTGLSMEMKLLREENQGMRQDLNEGLRAIALHTLRGADAMEDSAVGARPLLVQVV